VENFVTVLEEQGFVQIARGLDDEPDPLITNRGRAEAQALRERRADPAARLRYAQNAVIMWMFVHHRGSDQGRLRHAADRVVNALRSASKVTSALTLLIEQGHKAYTAVFGG
jgi:hypothetical protein